MKFFQVVILYTNYLKNRFWRPPNTDSSSSLYILTIILSAYATELPYAGIQDITHPTMGDFHIIQDYLKNGSREEIRRLNDSNYEYVCRNFKIIGEEIDEIPQFEIINVNCSLEEKENCILIYSSFNRNYVKGAERLIDCVKNSDFRGHILYRSGGWPDIDGGSLILAHVPYAFKVCFFKEARRLGYKRAFWLDTAFVPIVSPNEIFRMIEEKGVFVMGNTHMVGPFMNSWTARAFDLSIEQTYQIPSCSSGAFGVDFSTETGSKIIDIWYEAAKDKHAFFSARPDQNALSIILHKMGISDFIPIRRMPHTECGESIKEDSLLLLDRLFVHFK